MKKLVLAGLVLIMFLLSNLVWADAGDKIVRFGIKYVSPTGDLNFLSRNRLTVQGGIEETIEQSTVEPDSAVGLGVGFEYLITDLIGIDFNLNYSSHDVEEEFLERMTFIPDVGPPDVLFEASESGTIGDVTMMPLTVGVNFHLTRSDAVDFYFGPFVTYVFYGDLDTNEPGEEDVSFKNDLGYGAVVGIDVPFGSKGWMFSTTAKYIGTEADIDGPVELENFTMSVDPWVVQIGFGYKF